MNDVLISSLLSGVIALAGLIFILNRWPRSSRSNAALRMRGVQMLKEHNEASPEAMLSRFEELLREQTVVVEAWSTTPSLPAWVRGANRDIMTRYRTIDMSYRGIHIEVSLDSLRGSASCRVGTNAELDLAIEMDPETGQVVVGKDRFSSLAHYLVFAAE